MTFAPVLLLFLGISLPTLVLDYRSRLGFKQSTSEKSAKKNNSSFNFKFLILNFLLIVALGLGIFAILPRVPGYQLRSFPVSAPIKAPENFTGRNIINPGYVREGKGGSQGNGADGSRKAVEPGKLDDNFYYGFNSEMNQNLRGEMKPKLVMRVRSIASSRFLASFGF